jgi:hypothetical protein
MLRNTTSVVKEVVPSQIIGDMVKVKKRGKDIPVTGRGGP